MNDTADEPPETIISSVDDVPKELTEGDYAEAPEGWRTLAEMEATVSGINQAMLIERGDDDGFAPGAFIVTWNGHVVPVAVMGQFGDVESKNAWRESVEALIVKTRAQRVGLFMTAWALRTSNEIKDNPVYTALIDQAKKVATALSAQQLEMLGLNDHAEAEALFTKRVMSLIAETESAKRRESLAGHPDRIEVLSFQGEERGGEKYLHASYEFVREGGKIVGFKEILRNTDEGEGVLTGRYSNLFPALKKSVN